MSGRTTVIVEDKPVEAGDEAEEQQREIGESRVFTRREDLSEAHRASSGLVVRLVECI